MRAPTWLAEWWEYWGLGVAIILSALAIMALAVAIQMIFELGRGELAVVMTVLGAAVCPVVSALLKRGRRPSTAEKESVVTDALGIPRRLKELAEPMGQQESMESREAIIATERRRCIVCGGLVKLSGAQLIETGMATLVMHKVCPEGEVKTC